MEFNQDVRRAGGGGGSGAGKGGGNKVRKGDKKGNKGVRNIQARGAAGARFPKGR